MNPNSTLNIDFLLTCIDQLANVVSKKHCQTEDYCKEYYTMILVDILIQSKNTFSTKQDLQSALLKYFNTKWLLKMVTNQNSQVKFKSQQSQAQSSQSFFMTNLQKCDNTIIYLNQIIVRFIIVGLNLTLRRQIPSLFFKQLNTCVVELQMNLMLQGEISLSSLLLQYFKKIIEYFPYLEFYEYFLKLFTAVDSYHLIEYFQNKIKKFREDWDKKYNTTKINVNLNLNTNRASGKIDRESIFMPKVVSNKKQIQKTPIKKQSTKKEERTQIKTSQVKINQQISRKSLSRTLYHNTKMKYTGRKTQIFISKEARQEFYRQDVKQENPNVRQKRIVNSRINRNQDPLTPSNFNEMEVDVLAFGTPPKKNNKIQKKEKSKVKQLQI